MQRIERLRKWWDAIMARLKAANWLVWAFFVTLGFTVVAVAENEYAGLIRRLLAPLADILAAFVNAPMWKGGIVLLVLIAGLVTMAFLETRPRTLKSAPLSPEDHIEIERVRELWKADDVQLACSNLALLLLHAAEYYGDRGDPFADLLREPVAALQGAVKAVHESLETKPARLSEIQTSLRTLSGKYALAVCRLNRIRFVDPIFPEDKHEARSLDEWTKAHPAVAALYDTLNKRAAFERSVLGSLPVDPKSIEFGSEFVFEERVRNSQMRLVAMKLALLTEEQERFLDLFCSEDLPMVHEQSDTWLANDVYRAGEALVAAGLLRAAIVRPGVHRFCLSEETRRAWKPVTGYVKECIEINLDTVMGTGASGSGA